MSYQELISAVMTAITYGLGIGVVVSKGFLEIDENGFFIIRDNGLEEDSPEEKRKVYLDPSSVIYFLFNKDADLGDKVTPLICFMIDYLSFNNIKDLPSYTEIIALIKKIKKFNGESGTISFDYGRLKAMLAKVPRNENDDFIWKLSNMADLSFAEISNIAVTNPIFFGKLEKMAELEQLLERYCQEDLAKDLGVGQKGYDYRTDFLGLLDTINLSDYDTDWLSFYDAICCYNSAQMYYVKHLESRIVLRPDNDEPSYPSSQNLALEPGK